jgi:3-oxoacyl-[acyl-carrier-protein] synthase-3
MHSSLSNLRLAGLAVTTGSVVRDYVADGIAAGIDRAVLERNAKTLGLKQRRVAAPGITALDLCTDAATRLLADLGVDPTSLDAVIFVTQTPDYPQPNNASLLHGRLGLSKSAAAYDLSMGCSGWVYGLHQAALLCAHGGAARVLLCAGDTLSRLTHPGDRATVPLFGDAGSAVLIEKTGRSAPFHFVFGTDGSGARVICVEQGGARRPTGDLVEQVDADGNRRHAANLSMNGADVFSFTLREVPAAIAAVMRQAGWAVAQADALVLHQANTFILHQLAKKTGFDEAQVPSGAFERYGNQSSASLVAALADGFGARLETGTLRIVGCGFGVGLSWGAFAAELGPITVCPVLTLPR